jgi:hypothetical protein
MKRLTKKIKNTYCGYEVKNATYKQLFDLESNKQIENYVNCDLSIAIDKLGKLEDIEAELNYPLEIILKALIFGFYHNEIEHTWTSAKLYKYSDKYGFMLTERYGFIFVPFSDYKKTWWLKADRSE